MKLLIVNADDFGISPGVTAGIVEAHAHGIVTSTSMLVDTPFSAEAALMAREHPDLSVGLHACLTNENGLPAVDLDDGERCMAEVRRQLEHFTDLMACPPTHLDSHHHVHRDPRLRLAFAELADEYSLILRQHSGIRLVADFYGQWDRTTHPEQISVQRLIAMIDQLDCGVTELLCHPGHVDDDLRSSYSTERELELATLCAPAVQRKLAESRVQLIGFNTALARDRP